MKSPTPTSSAITDASAQASPFTIFVMLRTLPAWLALPRPQRNDIGQRALRHALKEGTVSVRHFDAEAFTTTCTDVAVFETRDLHAFYRVMERLRDSPLLVVPYFELMQIIPGIEDGFRQFEAAEA